MERGHLRPLHVVLLLPRLSVRRLLHLVVVLLGLVVDEVTLERLGLLRRLRRLAQRETLLVRVQQLVEIDVLVSIILVLRIKDRLLERLDYFDHVLLLISCIVLATISSAVLLRR